MFLKRTRLLKKIPEIYCFVLGDELFSDKIHLNSIPSLLGVPYRKVKKF
jgi:hypothetical protein